jgi:hypothetical protein
MYIQLPSYSGTAIRRGTVGASAVWRAVWGRRDRLGQGDTRAPGTSLYSLTLVEVADMVVILRW